MERPGKIRTPLRRRLQWVRCRLVPLVVWLGVVAVVVMFWRERVAMFDAPGMIEAERQAVIAPLQSGTLVGLTVGLSQEVEPGTVVARLDDAAVRAGLEVAQAELKRLQAELQATERRLRDEAELERANLFSKTRNYAVRTEQLRLDKLDRMIQLENDQVELQRLGAMLERSRALHDRSVIGDQEYDDVKFRYEALKRKIAASKEALTVVERQLAAALDAGGMPDELVRAESIEVALKPLREAINVQLKRLDEVRLQREALVLRSPIGGVITAVYRRVGDTVLAGDPVVAVADLGTMQVVSFVEQGRPLEPREGMVVEVRRRFPQVQVARARVVRVGSQVERIPRDYLGNSPLRRWGVRVLIELPRVFLAPPVGVSLRDYVPPRPGEPVDVRFFVRRAATRLATPRVVGPAS